MREAVGTSVQVRLWAQSCRERRLLAVAPANHPQARRGSARFEELLELEHIGIGETRALSLQLAEAAARLHRSIRHAQRVERPKPGGA